MLDNGRWMFRYKWLEQIKTECHQGECLYKVCNDNKVKCQKTINDELVNVDILNDGLIEEDYYGNKISLWKKMWFRKRCNDGSYCGLQMSKSS